MTSLLISGKFTHHPFDGDNQHNQNKYNGVALHFAAAIDRHFFAEMDSANS